MCYPWTIYICSFILLMIFTISHAIIPISYWGVTCDYHCSLPCIMIIFMLVPVWRYQVVSHDVHFVSNVSNAIQQASLHIRILRQIPLTPEFTTCLKWANLYHRFLRTASWNIRIAVIPWCRQIQNQEMFVNGWTKCCAKALRSWERS
jgi:hypothetical protein